MSPLKFSRLSTSIAVITVAVAVPSACGSGGADSSESSEASEPDCAESAPFESVVGVITRYCADAWECSDHEGGVRQEYLSGCLRQHVDIARTCHRAEDLLACSEETGRCAKAEAESCERAFAPCED